MPLFNHFFQINNCSTAVWKIEEREELLKNALALSPLQKQALAKRKTTEGRLGYLAVRAAFVHLGGSLDELLISSTGAPQLSKGYCSFSHTTSFAAAVISNCSVGVDVEAYRPKVIRVAPKFVHINEHAFLNDLQEVEGLTRLWTAKEAIYKAIDQQGLSLAQQIEVAPFTLNDSKGRARVYLPHNTYSIQLEFSTFEQHELTIAHSLHHESID